MDKVEESMSNQSTLIPPHPAKVITKAVQALKQSTVEKSELLDSRPKKK